MNALKNFGFDQVINKVIKEVGPKFFAEGANAMADKVSPIAHDLFRNGASKATRSEGAKLMCAIKEARKLRK